MILFVLVFVTSAIACNGGKNDKPSETQSIGHPSSEEGEESEESVASGGNAGQSSEEDKQSDGWFDIKL